jgi:hypothetical protein
MSTDYASQLLGGQAQPSEPPPSTAPRSTDYASDLLKPKDPFAQNIATKHSEVDKAAPFGALAKAAMVDDPKTKMRIYAESLFPGEKDAIERFGVVRGDIVYLGKDDKVYKAEPSGITGAPKAFVANMLGNALPILGGTAGAIVGAPAGPAGSVALGALGAAGGKGFQESIANVGLGEQQTVGGNLLGMGKEAGFSAAGGKVGSLLQKFLQRNMARDISKFDPNQVADLDAKAQAIGVDSLNVAQRTNVPSLKGRAEALARMPSSADDMNAALERTRQQAGAAADNYVAGVQTQTNSVRQAGEMGRSGANEILERIARDRSTAARPYYEKAFQTNIDPRVATAGEMKLLVESDAFNKAYERAARMAKNEGLDLRDEKNYMRVLHYVKMGLDDMLDPKVMAKEGIGATEQRGIVQVKNRLLKFMDSQSPDYARARSIYGHFMPTLKAQREGTLGAIADLADEDLHTAAKTIFNPKNSPEDVRQLRSMFFRYDQGEQWKALTKGYLQDTLENASREFKSGPGAGKAVTWRYMLMGDPKQAANLRAAMTTEQWQGFQDMMEVFEAVGRVQGAGNSITMPMQEAAQQLKGEASSKIAAALKPLQTVIDWLEEARMGKHASKQVEILNDPEGLARLKELRRLSPTSKQFIQGFSTLFGASASPE